MRYASPDGAGGDASQLSVGARSGIGFSSVPTKYGNWALGSAIISASFDARRPAEIRPLSPVTFVRLAHTSYVTDVKE